LDQPPCRQWLRAFWFQECSPSQWFVKDQACDELLRQRFIGLTRQAIAGELAAWAKAPGRGLALMLLLDQFPRQIWRDSAMAFSGDGQALALSQKALNEGWEELIHAIRVASAQ
jgi:uncharacterized protein (DUF924 family)